MMSIKDALKKANPKIGSKIIKAELVKLEMNYFDLERKLAEAGVNESVENIRNKMSRGSINTIFFLQCLRVLGVNKIEFNKFIDKDLFG
jgi:hypothetical protein